VHAVEIWVRSVVKTFIHGAYQVTNTTSKNACPEDGYGAGFKVLWWLPRHVEVMME
jgi:hypothetical protein